MTVTDPATLQTRLTEAETALHKLMVGGRPVSVSTDGETVTYNRANIGELRAYIQTLKVSLGQTPRKVIRPLF